MKYSCEIIQDLMPLVCDQVSSEESARAVEEHINECESCRKLYQTMKQPDEISVKLKEEFEKQELSSVKIVKKKWGRKKKILIAAGIAMGVALVYAFRKMIAFLGIIGILAIDVASTPVKVHTDIGNYQGYIKNYVYDAGGRATCIEEKYKDYTHLGKDMSIFPDEITPDMEVLEFKSVYYNPWDAQFISYLTVRYKDDAYRTENERLNDFGIKKLTTRIDVGGPEQNIYGVTGAPEGYCIRALYSDPYYGFIYALTPNAEDNTITYVEILFCNYFLDVDINKYLPNKYLLEGFDAKKNNAYEKAKLHKN